MATSEILKCDNCGSLNSFDPDISTKCVSCGASLAEEIERKQIRTKKTRRIKIPDEIIMEYLDNSLKQRLSFKFTTPSGHAEYINVDFGLSERKNAGRNFVGYVIEKVFEEIEVLLTRDQVEILFDMPFSSLSEGYFEHGNIPPSFYRGDW